MPCEKKKEWINFSQEGFQQNVDTLINQLLNDTCHKDKIQRITHNEFFYEISGDMVKYQRNAKNST